jgi:hypothetical protein
LLFSALALWTKAGGPPGDNRAAKDGATAFAFLPGTAVDQMLELEATSLAATIHIVADGRSAAVNSLPQYLLEGLVKRCGAYEGYARANGLGM